MSFDPHNVSSEASFDLTAMIDVVLLLIIFFTLTSQFSRSQQSAMDLPREKGEKVAEEASAAVVIDMDKDGGLRLQGDATSLDRLVQMVAADIRKAGKAEDVELIIRAERTCPAAHLNRLTSSLVQIGVRKWKLATDAEGGG